MAQRDPAAAISMHLGVKKRKHNDTSKSTTSGDLASSLAPCFLSQSQLEGMSDYDYADMDHNAFAPSPQVMTLEDTILKVKRLQAEGNTLAEAGLFQAAIARWQHGLDIDPTNGTLYELQAQAYLASNDVFRSIQAASRATELCPEWSDAFATLAHCQFNFGELELAHAALSQALLLETDAGQQLEWQVELDEMVALLAEQARRVAAACTVTTPSSSPDQDQVRTCKANLCRRSVHWS